MFYPTWTDVGIFVGSIGLFFVMFLLFIRVLPSVAMAEVKLLVKTSSEQAKKKLLDEGHVDPEQADEYIKSLEKYDSVDLTQYQKA